MHALTPISADVEVSAQWTEDLANPASWSSLGVIQTLISDGIIQHWEAAIPTDGKQKLFMKLKITKPAP